MIHRILNWHFSGDLDMPAFYAERDYEPTNIRLYARNAPSGTCKVDIRDDGVSILADYAKLEGSDNLEEDAEDFPAIHPLIEKGSIITCHIIETGGAGDVSVQLELESADGEDGASE